jgi:hypothetical protein
MAVDAGATIDPMSRQDRPTWRRMPRALFQQPALLMILSVSCSIAAIAIAVASSRRLAHVVAFVLVSIASLLAWRVARLGARVELTAARRGTLLEALVGLPPLAVRVTAVNERAAIRYARELRDVMSEAKWPVSGVFKSNGSTPQAGVVLAVPNVLAPSPEAMALMRALRRAGIPANWGHKPELGRDRALEVVIGPLR